MRNATLLVSLPIATSATPSQTVGGEETTVGKRYSVHGQKALLFILNSNVPE